MTATITNSVSVRTGTNDAGNQTILLDGRGQIVVGGPTNTTVDTGIYCYPPGTSGTNSNEATIRLHTNIGRIYLGGNQTNGQLTLFPKGVTNTWEIEQATIHLDAEKGDIILGGNGKHGGLELKTRTGTTTIHLDASTGDITLAGADCAEYFSVAEPQAISPGTVLIAESEDMLIPSKSPYDKRVVGVVSGGGNYKPGILLGKDLKEQGLPVALNGKVYCNVDASNGAINVGDLLTTSSTPGYAMKANDPTKSFGAVIGKALKPLPRGIGLIPILVSLQ